MNKFTTTEALQLIQNIERIDVEALTSAITSLTVFQPLTDYEMDAVIASLMIVINMKGGR